MLTDQQRQITTECPEEGTRKTSQHAMGHNQLRRNVHGGFGFQPRTHTSRKPLRCPGAERLLPTAAKNIKIHQGADAITNSNHEAKPNIRRLHLRRNGPSKRSGAQPPPPSKEPSLTHSPRQKVHVPRRSHGHTAHPRRTRANPAARRRRHARAAGPPRHQLGRVPQLRRPPAAPNAHPDSPALALGINSEGR